MPAQDIRWSQLTPIPDREGFAYPFAGVSHAALVVAGGANFPDKRPWEGGAKRWYDSVFVLERPDGEWKRVGKLPRCLGYGVSITTDTGILCLGGGNQNGHYAECFQLEWTGNEIKFTPLPPLPKPCANFCGAQIGNRVYVAGGLEKPDATQTLHTFWSLDLKDPDAGWKELQPWPGSPRMLATAGAVDGAFYLFSGTALDADQDGKPVRRWLRDAYCYAPAHGWKKIADLPRVSVAAPTPAPQAGHARLLVLGGDDGAQAHAPPTEHRGFPRDMLVYDATSDAWTTAGQLPFSLVTTPAVSWNERIIAPGGEARPGIRSAQVFSGQIMP